MLTTEQKESRKIGGSDSAAVMGQSRWKTRYRLWQEKTLQVESDDLSGKPSVEMGNIMEPVIRAEYTRRTGHHVEYDPNAAPLVHPEYEFITGNTDGMIVFPDGRRAVLECKNVNWRAVQFWDNGPPIEYVWQCYHYMYLTGTELAIIGACLGGGEIVYYDIQRPEPEIYAGMIAAYKYFWDCVVSLLPPEIISADEPGQRWPKDSGGNVTASDAIIWKVVELADVKQRIKSLEQEEETLKMEIQAFMADNQTLLSADGKKLHTWKTQESNRLDTAALKEEQPELYGLYCKKTVSRVFL